MFRIDEDKTIHLTRGDAAVFDLSAKFGDEQYTFTKGDLIRLSVYGKKNCSNLVLQKDVEIYTDTQLVEVYLTKDDTKFEEVINKPKDYWYEIELNPDGDPQTIIGYDEETGAKVFRLYPEGDETKWQK